MARPYTFKVRAVNASDNSAESDESAAATPALHCRGRGAATAARQSPDGSTLRRRRATTADWQNLTTSGTGPITATVSSLTNGTAYKFKVQAVNGVGDGAESDESSAVTPGLPGKPTITAVIPIGGCIIVRWDAPADNGGSAITGYKFDDPGDSSLTPTSVLADAREGTYGNNACTLLDSLTFGMQVRAVNANGDGPWSDPVQQKATKPVLTASSVTSSTVTLSISNHANAPWWYQGDQSGATCTKVAKGTASASLTGLDASTKYTYTAYYDDDCGSSSKHDDVEFTTAAAPTLAGSSVTHNSATLTISNYSGNWHYKYTSPTGGTCSTNAVSTTTKDVTGLDSNTSYTYKAYSDSSCTTGNLLATASAFLTKPGQPAKPTATAGAGSGKLTLASSVTGSGAISKW